MADYSLIPSLVQTSDDYAQNYTLGLGDAPVSPISAAVQGWRQGENHGANLVAKQLETKRLNDPDRLREEQLRRELENERLEYEIERASIENDFLPEEKRANLDSVYASTAQTRVNTQRNQIDLERQKELREWERKNKDRLDELRMRDKESATLKDEAAAESAVIGAEGDKAFGMEERAAKLEESQRRAKGVDGETAAETLAEEKEVLAPLKTELESLTKKSHPSPEDKRRITDIQKQIDAFNRRPGGAASRLGSSPSDFAPVETVEDINSQMSDLQGDRSLSELRRNTYRDWETDRKSVV